MVFSKEFLDVSNDMIGLFRDNPDKEMVGVLPHALMVYTLVDVDGWNALNFYGERGCTKAQWEIRHIASSMKRSIKRVNPELADYMHPRCQLLGECKEREPCGLYK